MHFTGMLAFRMGMPVTYDVPITLLSAVVAVAASTLVVVARGLSGWLPLLVAGPIMGIGIAGMGCTTRGHGDGRDADGGDGPLRLLNRRAARGDIGVPHEAAQAVRALRRDRPRPRAGLREADGDADRPLVTCHTLQEIAAVSCARVLHTEDNAINQKVAGRMLENLGYRVDIVSDGYQAVEAVSKGD